MLKIQYYFGQLQQKRMMKIFELSKHTVLNEINRLIKLWVLKVKAKVDVFIMKWHKFHDYAFIVKATFSVGIY